MEPDQSCTLPRLHCNLREHLGAAGESTEPADQGRASHWSGQGELSADGPKVGCKLRMPNAATSVGGGCSVRRQAHLLALVAWGGGTLPISQPGSVDQRTPPAVAIPPGPMAPEPADDSLAVELRPHAPVGEPHAPVP
jgi:hypothetical protein